MGIFPKLLFLLFFFFFQIILAKEEKSINFNGLIIERPRILVQSYRTRSSDPFVIKEEESCTKVKNNNCDDLVEPSDKRLGLDEGEQGEWSVPPNVTQLSVKCTSKSGPVEWDYQGKGRFPEIEIENVREIGDFYSPSTYTHTSTLTFNKVDDQITGNFICKNVEKLSVYNSFYLFVPQENRPILKSEQVVEVTPTSYDSVVVIPCRTEERESSIHLYKKLEDGTLKRMNMNPTLKFSPFLGFQIEISPETFGHYICKTDKPVEESHRRKKREAKKESQSPGFSAFPTSEELSAFLTPNIEIPATPPSKIAYPPRQRRWRNNNRPVLRRRVGVPFSRGPPPPPNHYRQRPVPFRPHPHPYPPPPHFHSSRSPVIVVPVGPDETFHNSSSQKDYFFPPLESSDVSPQTGILPTFVPKQKKPHPHIRPFASSEEDVKQKESSLEKSDDMFPKYSTRYPHGHPSSFNQSFQKPHRKKGAAAALLSQNLLPQTMTIMNSMGCVLKKVMLGPDTSCNSSFFDAGAAAAAASATAAALSSRNPSLSTLKGNRPEDQETLLEVLVHPPPSNKFFPQETILYTIAPFFVKWQTRSTDFSNWAEVNHTLGPNSFKLHKAGHFEDNGVHSFEVFNVKEGTSGRISVPYVSSNNKVLYHTWKFFVINGTTFAEIGLKQEESENKNVFTCKSATVNKPKITLTKLSDDGCQFENKISKRKSSKKKQFTEHDCGLGCLSIKTEVEAGIVQCVGDGVNQTIQFPPNVYCTGRPFFVERLKTKNLTLPENKKKLVIPCIINNPNADVYLFHQFSNGTIQDVTDHTTFDLKTGFSLNLEKILEPLGTYACTSMQDVLDDSDMVTYNVAAAPAQVFNPPSQTVFGTPPFRFVWESVEELEVENKSAGNFYSGVFAKPDANRPFVGTFEIQSIPKGGSGVVTVVRSRDKEVMHTWHYAYKGKHGLWVDRKLNVFKCKVNSSPAVPPSLFAVECSNPNVCKLKKRFSPEDEVLINRDNVQCGEGCRELKIWKNKPYGFVKCLDNKEDVDSMNYFLSGNSTLLTEADNLAQFRLIEISSVVRKLRVGETINFVCKANKYFYTKGFQWAVERSNGSKRFLDTQTKDTDSYLNEVKSEISVKVGDKDWKAVWCYAPSIDSNLWGNASQLIYIQ